MAASWGLEDFLPHLELARATGPGSVERLLHAARAAARPGPFEDDVSILSLGFH